MGMFISENRRVELEEAEGLEAAAVGLKLFEDEGFGGPPLSSGVATFAESMIVPCCEGRGFEDLDSAFAFATARGCGRRASIFGRVSGRLGAGPARSVTPTSVGLGLRDRLWLRAGRPNPGGGT